MKKAVVSVESRKCVAEEILIFRHSKIIQFAEKIYFKRNISVENSITNNLLNYIINGSTRLSSVGEKFINSKKG